MTMFSHNRMTQYRCKTSDPSVTLFVVEYVYHYAKKSWLMYVVAWEILTKF